MHLVTIKGLIATNQSPPIDMNYLIVAGGGGGGPMVTYGGGNVNETQGGGGGGAGGVLTGLLHCPLGQTYTITVGAGGVNLSSGSNSSIDLIESTGGGYGGGYYQAASDGGSGGGAGGDVPNSPGLGIVGQGHNGGTGVFGSSWPGAGGGGGGGGGYSSAGGNGLDPSSGASGGDGGAGSSCPWNILTTYNSLGIAGGGGGGRGVGGGTAGSASNGGGSSGGDGVVNTGGGGGGNTGGGGGGAGTGGSGVVSIQYASSRPDLTSVTGSPLYSDSGGYKTYTWTGSGSFTV